MFFDEQADAAVRKTLAPAGELSGLPSLETLGHLRHRPHVSLTVLETMRPPAVADAEDLVDVQRLPLLHFSALGTFAGDGGVLFLAAVVTTLRLAVHARLDELLQAQGRPVAALPAWQLDAALHAGHGSCTGPSVRRGRPACRLREDPRPGGRGRRHRHRRCHCSESVSRRRKRNCASTVPSHPTGGAPSAPNAAWSRVPRAVRHRNTFCVSVLGVGTSS
jgi:hypothetical protein